MGKMSEIAMMLENGDEKGLVEFFGNQGWRKNVAEIGGKEFIKAFDEIDEKNPLLRKLPIIAIVAPFVISYIIFYFIYYGDKIYNLSPHCQNTQDQNIKICKYSNGTYTGEMKAFRRHGQGEYIWDSGKTYKGKWKNGKKVN